MNCHKVCLVLVLAAAVALAAAPKFEVYCVTDDLNAGVTPVAAELNEWRTPSMDMRYARPMPENEVAAGPDFFTTEFGAPLAFSFTNGFGRIWGNKGRDDPKTPAIRFGRGWGQLEGLAHQLCLDIEQDVATSRWEWACGRAATGIRSRSPS